jgi:hypothetical protein
MRDLEVATTLFRGMSSGTKLLASFYRKEGGKYLRAIIEPVVREVISKSDSWEVHERDVPFIIFNDT